MIFTVSFILAAAVLVLYGVYMIMSSYKGKKAEIENLNEEQKITDVIHDFYDWEKGDDLYMLDWHYGTYQGILDDRRIVVKRPDGQMIRMDPFHEKIPFALVNRSTQLRREEKRSTEIERQLEESRHDEFVEVKKQVLNEMKQKQR